MAQLAMLEEVPGVGRRGVHHGGADGLEHFYLHLSQREERCNLQD